MRAGKLRHSIDIQETTQTRGSNGEVLDSWSNFATVRAEVTPMQGKESFLASQELSEWVVRFRIRYLSGVTAKMRVVYDGRVFDIESVVHVNERQRETHIITRETSLSDTLISYRVTSSGDTRTTSVGDARITG